MLRFLRASLAAHGYRLVEAATRRSRPSSRRPRARPTWCCSTSACPTWTASRWRGGCASGRPCPIIVLSARGQESDKIAALDAGADDYLTKPFGVGELLARMRVALRHAARVAAGRASRSFEAGDLRVDLAARRVFVRGEEVRLTPTEYKLLATLVRHAGKVLTHRQLLQEVWGPGSAGETHYLRVYMGQLRHKLEEDPARPRYLLTETGVGYRLAVD